MTSRWRGQWFCDNSAEAIVTERVTVEEGGGSKIVQNCVTSFMDDSKDFKALTQYTKKEGNEDAIQYDLHFWVQWKTLNLITLRPGICDHFNQMIQITDGL